MGWAVPAASGVIDGDDGDVRRMRMRRMRKIRRMWMRMMMRQGTRMLLLALRAAPVQLSWLGCV